MSSLPLRVIKIGGSLLDLPDLGARLGRWRASQIRRRDVLIGGGGRLADEVRRLETIHDWSAETSHWLCIALLGVSAEIIQRLTPTARLCRTLDELCRAEDDETLVFDCREFCERAALTAPHYLPRNWETTSDSIAAAAAQAVGAEELVLLKSTLPARLPRLANGAGDLAALAEAGYVDARFERAVGAIGALRCVNFRDDAWPTAVLRGSSGE